VRRRASCDTERASPHGRSQRPPHPGVAGSTSPSASPALIQLSLLRGPLMETSLRPSAFRQLVWRASASSAGLLEDSRLTLYYAPRRQGPFAATWDMTGQLGGGGSQVSRQQGGRRLPRLAVIARPRRGWYENRPPPGEIFVLCENLFRCSINSCSSVGSRSRCLEWRPEIVGQKKTRSPKPYESRVLMVNL